MNPDTQEFVRDDDYERRLLETRQRIDRERAAEEAKNKAIVDTDRRSMAAYVRENNRNVRLRAIVDRLEREDNARRNAELFARAEVILAAEDESK